MDVQLWHVLVAGLSTLAAAATILGVYHAVTVAPEKARRKGVSEKLAALDKRTALVEQRLESGDRKFSEMAADVKEIKASMQRLELAVARSVWRGVGEPA